jgi:hypothetical protein
MLCDTAVFIADCSASNSANNLLLQTVDYANEA